MIYQAKSLIKFLRLSKNKHGIHSPFVYSLVTQCFNDRTKYPEYTLLKNFRRELRTDHSIIHMTDCGQGSRVFKSMDRKVSQVAKLAGLKKKRQKLLFRLARYLSGETMLELGTSLGLGTTALAISNDFAQVHTVEGCGETLGKARENFKRLRLSNIRTHHSDFLSYIETDSGRQYDLVFVDGDHNGERTYRYFEKLLKNVHNHSVIIFDDIYWSKDMTAAWNRIISHPKVSVSIDTFQWGLVFFRREQRKQHFYIRI